MNASEIPSSCWAIASGGTRRAFLARGGSFASAQGWGAYATWLTWQVQQMADLLFDLGVTTLILVGRLPVGRGTDYDARVSPSLRSHVVGPDRLDWYHQRQLQVSVAAGMFPDLQAQVQQATADHQGPQLIYLFRPADIAPGMEEVQWGVRLMQTLGRVPTRAELVRAYYGLDVPALAGYVGSGRPRLGNLRPLWISGHEECYWSAWSPILLTRDIWHQILHDQQVARRTDGNRAYTDAAAQQVRTQYRMSSDAVLGLGHQVAGGWQPCIVTPHVLRRSGMGRVT